MIEVKVPELPESITEATVGEWLKSEGDRVERDENIVDLETDKVMLEVPVTADGVLKEIKVQAGDTVSAGDVLAVLEEGEAEAGDGRDSGGGQAEASEEDTRGEDGGGDAAAAAAEPDKEKSEPQPEQETEPTPSPAARKLLDEHGLDRNAVEGSGKDGRVTKADVLKAVESREQQSETTESGKEEREQAEKQPEDVSHETADRAALSGGQGDRVEQRVPMTRIRARIAERLLEATRNTAMLTTFNEVDMQAVQQLRERYKEQFEKNHEVRLGIMSFFVKAVVEALKRFPMVNASIDEEDVVYHGYYDIGIAVSSPRGLLVPILRDADQLSYAEIESTIRDFGKRAQQAKITMDELKGGTFTITNGGVFGSLLSTPLLNPPQSAILGMHGTRDKPVVVDGEIVIRPMMYLALSYDHRLVDGREAVLFLRTIKELIEDPARLLLQI